MTPIKGGRATGSATSVPSRLRPGNSLRSNTKASGIPMSAASATVAVEIHTLAQSADHSAGRRAKSTTWASVQWGAPNASAAVRTSG